MSNWMRLIRVSSWETGEHMDTDARLTRRGDDAPVDSYPPARRTELISILAMAVSDILIMGDESLRNTGCTDGGAPGVS
jgi:hypothetical protein